MLDKVRRINKLDNKQISDHISKLVDSYNWMEKRIESLSDGTSATTEKSEKIEMLESSVEVLKNDLDDLLRTYAELFGKVNQRLDVIESKLEDAHKNTEDLGTDVDKGTP